eukprot:COSAG01_NODE_346_length_18524_cov_35.929661_13_plen_91_part_01
MERYDLISPWLHIDRNDREVLARLHLLRIPAAVALFPPVRSQIGRGGIAFKGWRRQVYLGVGFRIYYVVCCTVANFYCCLLLCIYMYSCVC